MLSLKQMAILIQWSRVSGSLLYTVRNSTTIARLATKESETIALFDNIVKLCNISIKMVTKDYGNCLMSLNDILFNIPQDKKIKKAGWIFCFYYKLYLNL